MNLKNRITRRKFNNLIEDGVLVVPKTQIARHFGMSKKTLLKWMRKNGYEDLIVAMKGRRVIRRTKVLPEGIKVIQEKVGSMNYIQYNKERDKEPEEPDKIDVPDDFTW